MPRIVHIKAPMVVDERRRLIETGLVRECADGPGGPLVFGPVVGHDAVITAGDERAFIAEGPLHERGVVVAGELFEPKAFLEVADADIADARAGLAVGCTRP